MVFLNPSFLWLAAAAGIPVIIHLFNLRRPKTVLFSNVAALKEVQRSVTRRLQLKQWLLLAIRILAILALALAFARPVFQSGVQNVAIGTRSSVILVMDDSWSMTAGDEQGPFWLQGRTTALGILNAYSDLDEFLVLPLSLLRQHAAFVEKEIAVRQAEELRPGGGAGSLAEITGRISALFSRAGNADKHLYLISDFQRSTVLSDSLEQSLDSMPVHFHLIPVGNRQEKNVYLGEVLVQQQLVQAGSPVEISVEVVNDHPEPVQDLNLRLLMDGITVGTSSVNLGPGQSQVVSLSFTPQKPGWLSGWVEIDDQPVTFDNKRYFSLEVPERQPILLVQGEQPVQYLDLLFQEVFTSFDVTRISYKQLAGTDFGKFHAIILSAAGQLSQGVHQKLSDFVKNEGGLILIPDEKTGAAPYKGLCEMLNIPAYEKLVIPTQGLSASQADLEHPVFRQLFKPTHDNRQVDAPVIFRYYTLGRPVSGTSLPFLRMRGGIPAIIDHTLYDGQHVFQFTFPLSANATDLPLKSLFPPIMLRMANLAAHTSRFPASVQIGSDDPVRIPSIPFESLRMTGADTNVAFIPEVIRQSGEVFLDFSALPLPPGNYSFLADGKLIGKAGFNIPHEESRLEMAHTEALSSFAESQGMQNVTIDAYSPEKLTGIIKSGREGTQVWKWLLVFTLFLIFCEILIVRYLPS